MNFLKNINKEVPKPTQFTENLTRLKEDMNLHGNAFTIYCQLLSDFAAAEQYSCQNLRNISKRLEKDILSNPKNVENREYTIYGNFSTIVTTLANHREKLSEEIRDTLKELKGSYFSENNDLNNKTDSSDNKLNTKELFREIKNTDEIYKNYYINSVSSIMNTNDNSQEIVFDENDLILTQKKRLDNLSEQLLKTEKEKNVFVNDSVMKLIIHNISFLKNVEYDLQPIIPKEESESLEKYENLDDEQEYNDDQLKRILEKLLEEPTRQDYLHTPKNEGFNLKKLTNIFDQKPENDSNSGPSYRPEQHNLQEKTIMLYYDTMNNTKIRENFSRLNKDENYNIRFDEVKLLVNKIHKMLHTVRKDDVNEIFGEAERDLDYIVSAFKMWYNRLLIGIYFE